MEWTTEQLEIGLYVCLGLTVAVLGATIFLAHKGKVRAHIGGVGVFLVVFLVTVYFADTYGRHFDFSDPHVSYAIHMTLAILTSVLVLAPLGTGFQHWRGKCSKKLHKISVWTWGVTVALSLGSGAWMITNAELKAEHGGPAKGPDGIAPAKSD